MNNKKTFFVILGVVMIGLFSLNMFASEDGAVKKQNTNMTISRPTDENLNTNQNNLSIADDSYWECDRGYTHHYMSEEEHNAFHNEVANTRGNGQGRGHGQGRGNGEGRHGCHGRN